MNQKSVGSRIRSIREHFGYSVAGLAKRAGLTYNKVRDIEREKTQNVNPRDLRDIAHACGVSPDWLIEGTGEMLVDVEFREKLLANAVLQGIVTAEEIKMIRLLRDMEIDTKEKLLSFLNVDEVSEQISNLVRAQVSDYLHKNLKQKK